MIDDSRTVRLPAEQYRKLVYLSVGTGRTLSALLAEGVDALVKRNPQLSREIAVEATELLERAPVHAKSTRKRHRA